MRSGVGRCRKVLKHRGHKDASYHSIIRNKKRTMEREYMKLNYIDNGKEFDWGKTSNDYAIYRDIYSDLFYDTLYKLGVGNEKQDILDFGTGTGVLPRNMYRYGANFIGTDISENQIAQAIRLSREKNMNINWKVCAAENTGFEDCRFDIITAVQCWWYFNTNEIVPEVVRMLKPGGKLVIISVNWLPEEDKIAKKTEELVLKYNPEWKGANYQRESLKIPEWIGEKFRATTLHTFDDYLSFTRESWAGRIRACRGIGASLTDEVVQEFNEEHLKLLSEIAELEFKILHQVMIQILTVNK